MDEPPDDDGYRKVEDLLDDGWLCDDDVEELRNLMKHLDVPETKTEGFAAFVLIEHILHSPVLVEGSPEAIRYKWAKVKLGRNALI